MAHGFRAVEKPIEGVAACLDSDEVGIVTCRPRMSRPRKRASMKSGNIHECAGMAAVPGRAWIPACAGMTRWRIRLGRRRPRKSCFDVCGSLRNLDVRARTFQWSRRIANSIACSIVIFRPTVQAVLKYSAPNMSRSVATLCSWPARSTGGMGEPIASRNASADPKS